MNKLAAERELDPLRALSAGWTAAIAAVNGQNVSTAVIAKKAPGRAAPLDPAEDAELLAILAECA